MGAWHVHGDQFLAKGCAGRAVFKICAAYFKLGQVLRVAAKMAFDSSPIIAVTQEAYSSADDSSSPNARARSSFGSAYALCWHLHPGIPCLALGFTAEHPQLLTPGHVRTLRS